LTGELVVPFRAARWSSDRPLGSTKKNRGRGKFGERYAKVRKNFIQYTICLKRDISKERMTKSQDSPAVSYYAIFYCKIFFPRNSHLLVLIHSPGANYLNTISYQ
jgi:hypothetical protein